MKYIPFDKYTFESRLSERQIQERLHEFVETRTLYRWRIRSYGSRMQYTGRVGISSFNITRIISGRRSFQPWIIGSYKDGAWGTVITVKMRLHWVLLPFFAVWALAFLLPSPLNPMHAGITKSIEWSDLIAVGLVIIFYAFMVWGFKKETRRSVKDLEALFETEAIPG